MGLRPPINEQRRGQATARVANGGEELLCAFVPVVLVGPRMQCERVHRGGIFSRLGQLEEGPQAWDDLLLQLMAVDGLQGLAPNQLHFAKTLVAPQIDLREPCSRDIELLERRGVGQVELGQGRIATREGLKRRAARDVERA